MDGCSLQCWDLHTAWGEDFEGLLVLTTAKDEKGAALGEGLLAVRLKGWRMF
jgi:hypothetical protein